MQVAEEAVPQAEKAAKAINQQADKVAENLEPMADKASQRLQREAKQVSEEGPQAADKLQGQVDDLASRVAKEAKPQADKAAQLITGFAQGIKETAEPTAKVFVSTFWLPEACFVSDASTCNSQFQHSRQALRMPLVSPSQVLQPALTEDGTRRIWLLTLVCNAPCCLAVLNGIHAG